LQWQQQACAFKIFDLVALTAKRFNEAVTAAPSFARANTCFFCFYAVKTRTSPARDGCAAVAPSLVNNQARKGYAQKKIAVLLCFPNCTYPLLVVAIAKPKLPAT